MKIPNIFHFVYHKENDIDDIEIHKYFGIKSAYEINNLPVIYFHYYNNLPDGLLWDKIKNILTLNKLDDDEGMITILKILLKFGGVYLNINTISINPINKLLKYNFFKSENNEIIGAECKSYMIHKYLEYYINPICQKFNEKFGIRNINGSFVNNYIIPNLNYDNSSININNIIFQEICDYSFGQYFHLIKNCLFICFPEINIKNINMYDIFNKNTIYNLLIRNALIYNLINNDNLYIIDKSKYQLINNIDIIYWINLESSIDRKNNMNIILDNFDIKNEIIKAIDGNIEENIHKKYFYAENNIYPKYSNKEYAVLLSHLSAIEKYANNTNIKFNVGLICEDDLSLDFINYWNTDIQEVINNAPDDWEIIMLGYFSLNINNNILYKKWNNEWSAISYLVNYKTINKIFDLKKDNKWICKESDLMVSDNYIFSKFNTYVYKYPFITFPNTHDSTFHKDHLDYHRIYKISNYMTLENMYDKYI